jgi:glycosyltransferase involved in cell wall biosynthesis
MLLDSRASISPSIWFESQPLSVLEAFAAGTPVLASAIGGLGETVAPLGPDWRVRSGDVAAWSVALERLADDAFVDHAGRVARAAFELKHTPAEARDMLERTYAEAGLPTRAASDP